MPETVQLGENGKLDLEAVVEAVVCIVESASEHDLSQGHREGVALSEALTLAHIKNKLFTVDSQVDLDRTFAQIAEFARPRPEAITSDGPPDVLILPQLFLHFSCHGNEDGIRLTNGDFISWEELGTCIFKVAQSIGVVRPPVAL